MGIYIPNMERPESCWQCYNENCDHWGEYGYDNSGDCPLIDIVRCGECKYWEPAKNGWNGYCENKVDAFNTFYANDFCSFGERRADGDI